MKKRARQPPPPPPPPGPLLPTHPPAEGSATALPSQNSSSQSERERCGVVRPVHWPRASTPSHDPLCASVWCWRETTGSTNTRSPQPEGARHSHHHTCTHQHALSGRDECGGRGLAKIFKRTGSRTGALAVLVIAILDLGDRACLIDNAWCLLRVWGFGGPVGEIVAVAKFLIQVTNNL